MEGTDVCFAPVLDLKEAPSHPHNVARDTYINYNGVTQPAPAPRFSRTQSQIQSRADMVGEHSEEIISETLENKRPHKERQNHDVKEDVASGPQKLLETIDCIYRVEIH